MVSGNLLHQEYAFDDRSTCVIGRALDCNILLPDDQAHSTISRYHCLLDINPPEICIRDFGSLNGTYVNGNKIGQRAAELDIAKAHQMIYPEFDLNDGDQIKIGETVFQVLKEDGPQNNMGKSAPANKQQGNLKDEDPLDRIKLALNKADQGNEELISIKGYKIEKELGRGSMGAVYLASREGPDNLDDNPEILSTKVALKVLLPRVENKPKAQQQFIRETKNTRLLNHKNIVSVHDIGYSDNTYFYTTEYCEAGSVAELIKKKGGKLPLFMALKILLQVLEGLHYAHTVKVPSVVLANGKTTSSVGLVHRDLKPGNLLLTEVDGLMRVKIADFGLAKAFDTAGLSGRTATGVSAGTPFFMPRQQVINFKLAKPEVDVWASAASFYKMVTGKFPRNYTRETDPWLTTLKTMPVPIREREPSIPKSLANVIDTALRDQPEIVYKNAEDFKEEILKVI